MFLTYIYTFVPLLGQTIIQKDIPLPLPFPEWALVILLVVSFLVHLLFINFMVGGTILTLIYQLIGLRKKEYDKLAYEITQTVTVNKSMAIVMGVAPLLLINTLYTTYFYAANALTGLVWILVIPLVSIALLILYAHKYLWHKLENNKFLHLSMIATVVAIFLFIPLVFLTNINLMLFPDKWGVVTGFFSALLLPNVFPRYVHFLNACMAATGLLLVWYLGRKSYPFEEKFPKLSRFHIRRQLYSITFWGSAIQFLVGPIVLISLPSKGIAWNMIIVISVGVLIATFAMIWLWKEINADEMQLGKYFGRIAISMGIVVVFMGSGRHLYRANTLAPHQKLVRQKTEEYMRKVEEAKAEALLPKPETASVALMPGQKIFEESCVACHQINEKLVGPSMKEASSIYKGDIAGLMAWIKKPGKKREGIQMPAQTHLSDQQIKQVAEWILTL